MRYHGIWVNKKPIHQAKALLSYIKGKENEGQEASEIQTQAPHVNKNMMMINLRSHPTKMMKILSRESEK